MNSDQRVLGAPLTYHYAPPSVQPVDAASDGKAFRVALPTTDYHCANVTTALKLTWGMTKLLGVWKPEGAPEFDGKDVMQAAFLRVDRAPTGKE